MTNTSRRQFLRNLAILPAGFAAGMHAPFVAAGAYTGKLFVFVQADGAWDPTSFCDPKANVAGEAEINHWSRTKSVQQAGNIAFAPFGTNASFFPKYYDRMLVINGVDAQTNSHTVGVVHSWSGRVSEGFPTMTSLLAAHYAPALSMPYLNFGGFGATGGLIRSTRINNPNLLTNIAYPQTPEWDSGSRFIEEADWALVRAFNEASVDALATQPGVMPRALRNREIYSTAQASAEEVKVFADLLPAAADLEKPYAGTDFRSTLRQQVQLTVLAFRAGVAISADLYLGGFDTHARHDVLHEPLLAHLTDSVDFLWEYAESQGIADRLVVVMGSDFGRTPRYNASEGKDHWPITSVIVMEKNTPWGNAVVGQTDGGHNARRINPTTLARDDSNGTIIYPKHVHKALRRYLGIEGSPVSQAFPFNNTEDFDLFG